ncbi:YgcG family protein [Aquimarina sp. AU474]|uniref:TPM domain-containing protein n=1 Tax=Aquimarina sp. AU474 TaxID=2108529 RepID=UPI000D6906C1|nr:TPM domain-containing protein [Aquimarina sp. AU474]
MKKYYSFQKIKITLVFYLVCVFTGFCQNPVDIILSKRVTDNAHVFSNVQTEELERLLIDFEERTSNQIAVVTIASLSGLSIEQTAFEVFNKNKLGQKEKDNGVLILFAKNDQKVRIEVGYGLEESLTDLLCGKIIRQIMIPEFKNEAYATGIQKGVDIILHHLGQPYGYTRVPEETYLDLTKESNDYPWFVILFMILFTLPFLIVGFFVQRKNPLWKFSNYINFYTGKNSVLGFIPQILSGLFLIPFLAFIIMPLIAFGLFLEIDFESIQDFFSQYIDFFDTRTTNQTLRIIGYLSPIFLFFLLYGAVLPILWILLIQKKPLNLKFKLTKAEKALFRTYSSSGSSSSSGSFSSGSSFSSSSSSSSFGGGGSSGGGGASGSW